MFPGPEGDHSEEEVRPAEERHPNGWYRWKGVVPPEGVSDDPAGTRTAELARQRDQERRGHPVQPVGRSKDPTTDLAYERDRNRATGSH